MTPPPVALFQKFIQFGSGILPLKFYIIENLSSTCSQSSSPNLQTNNHKHSKLQFGGATPLQGWISTY